MNITDLTVHELKEKIDSKELKVTDIVKAYIDRIDEKEKDVDAFLTILKEEALSKAKDIQTKIDSGDIKKEFAGITIGIK